MSIWTSDDLFFLEAAYTSGLSLSATAQMLRKPQDEVCKKALEEGFIVSPKLEEGFIVSPKTVPDADSADAPKARATALSE
jgi:hypothetical protein